MQNTVGRNGEFILTLLGVELAKGLHPFNQGLRNDGMLSECEGAIGKEGAIAALENIIRTTTGITDAFPYPQVFVLKNVIIVCGATSIYEYIDGTLTLVYTAAESGSLWEVADFYDYLYLSNGVEAVVRDAKSKAYSKSTALPTATAICNNNGQVLVGAPNVVGLGAGLVINNPYITVTTSADGEVTCQ